MDANQTPRSLLALVASTVTDVVRAVVDHPPATWRSDGAAYVTVRQPTPTTASLRGDDEPLAYTGFVQVDLWERRATEDPSLLVALFDELILTALSPWGRPRLDEVVRVPDDDPDIIHHAIGLRYHSAR